MWVIVAVKADFSWPADEFRIRYLGHEFLLRPETESDLPTVCVEVPAGEDLAPGRLRINRFLSALAWNKGAGVKDLWAFGSNGRIPSKARKPGNRIAATSRFRADHLVEPVSEQAQRALALFREASSLNSPAYAFLGYFKCLNILFSGGREQIAWLNDNLAKVAELGANRRLGELRRLHADVGDYLYTQGRCAVSHAFAVPVVDPDETADARRLYEDIPLIRELAEIAIENHLGVESYSTYRHEHRYELAGFVALLGDDAVSRLRSGAPLVDDYTVDLPRMSLRLRDQVPFQFYENLAPMSIRQDGAMLHLDLRHDSGLLGATIQLDFAQWRHRFDPYTDTQTIDDGSSNAMRIQSETALFVKGKYCNGEIEVYNAETGALLARSDPYIPVNIDLRSSGDNLDNASAAALEEALRRDRANAAEADRR